jgi:hypothetical protein
LVPDLYPKLEMGSRPLKGTEAEEVLKAVDLKALPQVFYGGEQGLNLVVKDGAKFVPNSGFLDAVGSPDSLPLSIQIPESAGRPSNCRRPLRPH